MFIEIGNNTIMIIMAIFFSDSEIEEKLLHAEQYGE